MLQTRHVPPSQKRGGCGEGGSALRATRHGAASLESNPDPAAHRLPDGMGMIRSEMDLRAGSRFPATGLAAIYGFSGPLRRRSCSRSTR